MTIEIFTGVPGAGKTYLAVKRLSEKYYTYSKKDELWTVKQKFQDYTIFTNITGLALPGVKDLDSIFTEQNITFDYFFSKDYQDKLHRKYPKVIFVIDECQQYIPYRYANKDVILYFDTHRHYGDHIILITQDMTKITRSISTLCELEYRAVKRTMSVAGEFKYNIRSSGEIFKREACKPDKKIFALYKSFEGNDMQTVRNNLKYYIIALLVAFIGLGYYFYNYAIFTSDKKPDLAAAQKPDPVSKNIKRSFIDEQPYPDHEPKEDRYIQIRLRNYVADENNNLIMFLDPFRDNHIIDYHNCDYEIKFFPPSHYYIIIKESRYDKLTKNKTSSPV